MSILLSIDDDVRATVTGLMFAFQYKDGTWEGDSFREVAENRIQTLVNDRKAADMFSTIPKDSALFNSLPNVSATETADLRDVHKRLAVGAKFSYWRSLLTNELFRVCPWAHQFFPRWF